MKNLIKINRYLRRIISGARVCAGITLAITCVQVIAEPDIAVTGLIGERALLRINGNYHTLAVEESGPAGIRVLSIDKGRRYVVLNVNGERRKFLLGAGTGSGRQSVTIKPDRAGMYRIEGKINDTKVPFIVDTGATFVTINRNMADELGINESHAKMKGQAETVNGKVPIYIVGMARVEVAGLTIEGVDIAVHKGDYPSIALLGMSFLKKTSMEHVGDNLRLKKNY